jgi:hypothetical protein
MCVNFGGLSADRLISEQLLRVIKPMGIQAAMEAMEKLEGAEDARVAQKRMELERARYEVSHAQRQYDAVDPANRLVANTLERRWNDALSMQARLEEELAMLTQQHPQKIGEDVRQSLLALSSDLPQLWEHSASSPDIKKRILRTVINEIVVTTSGESVRMIVHWQGGDHTELMLKKTPTGKHRYATSAETIALIASLARQQPDHRIAATINQLGYRTARGNTWTATRVCAIRKGHGIAVYCEGERQTRGELYIEEAAAILKIAQRVVLRLIHQKHLKATQACRNAPWTIRQADPR